MLIDYTEKHPEVIYADHVIAEIKNKIVDMLKDFSKIEFTPAMESDMAIIIKIVIITAIASCESK